MLRPAQRRELQIYRDHVGAAPRTTSFWCAATRRCYVLFRRDRRKGLPLFASFIYVSNPALFRGMAGLVFGDTSCCATESRTLVELRVVGSRPRLSIMLRSPRPKMFRSPTLAGRQIDYLYSELACVFGESTADADVGDTR